MGVWSNSSGTNFFFGLLWNQWICPLALTFIAVSLGIVLSGIDMMSTSHQIQSGTRIQAFVDCILTLLLQTRLACPEFAIHYVVGARRAIIRLTSNLVFYLGNSRRWCNGRRVTSNNHSNGTTDNYVECHCNFRKRDRGSSK